MLKKIHLSAVICLLATVVAGQGQVSDTIIQLDPVTISASRVKVFAIGQSLVVADSLDMHGDPAGTVDEVLSAMSSIHIKNYGDGTLSTVSMRGTSANHTGLIWNGIRVSPPNIGYVDLSMLRSDFFDEISLLYGGSSPMFGSGFIGGSIHLAPMEANGDREGTLKLGGSYGSFGFSDFRAMVKVVNQNFSSRTSAFYNRAANDFPYKDLYGNKKKLPHADFSRTGAMQEIGFDLGRGQSLTTAVWFQYADRNIPPTLTEAVSEANQVDRSVRLLAHWKDVNAKNTLEFKAAYFNDFIRYTDPRHNVYSTIATQSAVGQFESSWSLFSSTKIYAGASYTFDLAKLTAYGDPKHENALAVFASLLQPVDAIAWKFVLHLRQEFLSAYRHPFVFGFSAEGRIAGPFSMQASFSRNFRAPTMNERYWFPGGNPDLAPENSWNGDLSFQFQQQYGQTDVQLRMTLFNSIVDDWILWVPGESFWSAENVRKVWARGVEVLGEQSWKMGRVNMSIKESYSYTRSTNENELPGNDQAYQKQLIYTPVHKGLLRIFLGYKGYGFMARNTLTSKVFTTRDNSSDLDGYYVLDISVSKRWVVKHRLPLTASINANNLLNSEYQVTPYRPLPGIHVLLNLNVELNLLKNN